MNINPSRNPGRMKIGLEATEHPSVQDICWAAELYEGEGSCAYSAGTQHACMDQKDLWPLQRFQTLFGGRISPHKTLHSWNISGSRARGFLMTIYKFLSPRRKEQVRKALGII